MPVHVGKTEFDNIAKNVGAMKLDKLFDGSATSGTVTLLGDITKYKLLHIQTGAVGTMTFETAFSKAYGDNFFRVTTYDTQQPPQIVTQGDVIRVKSANGAVVALVTSPTQITIQGTAPDALRTIYGVKAYQ